MKWESVTTNYFCTIRHHSLSSELPLIDSHPSFFTPPSHSNLSLVTPPHSCSPFPPLSYMRLLISMPCLSPCLSPLPYLLILLYLCCFLFIVLNVLLWGYILEPRYHYSYLSLCCISLLLPIHPCRIQNSHYLSSPSPNKPVSKQYINLAMPHIQLPLYFLISLSERFPHNLSCAGASERKAPSPL